MVENSTSLFPYFRGCITSDTKTFDPSLRPGFLIILRTIGSRFDHAVIRISTCTMKQKQYEMLKRRRAKGRKRATVCNLLNSLTSSKSLASRDTLVCHQLSRKSVHENVSRVVVPVLVFGGCTSLKEFDVLPPFWIPASTVPA